MLTQHLLAQLLEDPRLRQIPQQLQFGQRHFILTGLTPSAKAAYLAILHRLLNQPILYVGLDNPRLDEFRQATSFFHRMLSGRDDEFVAVFPGLEPGPYSGFSPHAEVLEQRALTLWKLFQNSVDILLVAPAALLTRMPDAQASFGAVPQVAVGAELPPEELAQFLLRSGYVRQEPVSSVGAFSIRGGILDVFPPNSENPLRIEFFGDEIESLREFSVKSQRSIGPVQKLSLPPMRELPIEPEQLRQWSEFAERTFPPEEYGEFLGSQGIRARNGEAFPGCEYLLPSVAPLSKTLLDFTPDFFLAVDEPQDLNRWFESWTAKNERDFSDQHLMGIPASAPSTLVPRGE